MQTSTSITSSVEQLRQPPAGSVRTTLYDIMASIQESLAAEDRDEVATATIVHLMQTHRVMGTGRFKGQRLLCRV